MITAPRALVFPGEGRWHGHWFSAYRYQTHSGTGVHVVGGPFVKWDAAARLAVTALRMEQRRQDELRRLVQIVAQ